MILEEREISRKEAKYRYKDEQLSDNFGRSNRKKVNIASAILKVNNLRAPILFCILGAPILFSSAIPSMVH